MTGGTASSGEGPAGGAGSVETGEFDPLFPYPNTEYAEPYRPQFHFSPASGWMNDVDGLWFAEGLYHLTHQASPFALEGGKNMHWGHATSTDLLHWQQQPLALVPGVSSEGEAWSGSVVVDLDDTSGLQQGDRAPVVAIFTSTTLGTSLAYSTDAGQSFVSFQHNPLAIGDASYAQNRDPTVIWHAPTKRWVCVYWEAGGTSFYTSPDLKTWTLASSLAFGGVVPDFYELPLDGDVQDTRWVLQNGDGAYLVGSFDGQKFTPESSEPKDLDVGPHFFASHTFFRPSLPDARVVQIGWLRDGGVPSAPFRGAATFPVELRLKSTPTGLVVTRTPVQELERLYRQTKRLEGTQLATGANLLAGIRSKTFDWEVTFDLSKTAATTLVLRIADQTLTYDVTAQSLEGVPFPALDGRLSLRFLVDWSSVEVFGNGGELSYSSSVPFAPDDASLSFTADGVVSVVAAEFRDLARVWPGSADALTRVVDDASAEAVYGGEWRTVTDDPTFLGGTCHYSKEVGATLEVTFTGTRLEWFGLRNTDLGKVDAFVDDVLVAEGLDCYAPLRAPAQLLVVSGLEDTLHTLRIVLRADKHPSATGTAVVHDYFVTRSER